SYLQNKDLNIQAELLYDSKTKELTFDRSMLAMEAQKYALSGCFILRNPMFLNLYIDNHNCNFDVAKTALTPRIQKSLSSVSIPQPVRVGIAITGETQPGFPPMVDVFMQLKNQGMKAYKLDFTDMNMHGFYSNHLDK